MTKLQIDGIDQISTSPKECQNFIALPGRELLEEHNCIEKIDTYESEVPNELSRGIMCIGTNTYRGNKTEAYISDEKEYKNLTLCIAGPTRSGKSTLLQNLTKNAIDNNECVIVPDYISWCKLSYELRQVIPKSKQLIIDLEDLENLPGFGFNELWITNRKPLEKYDSAKRQTAQLSTLIDSINEKDLSGKMDRYLKSAALIVFTCYGSFNDVFDIIKNHKKRHEYLKKIPKDLKCRLEEYIDSLKELDDKDKDGNITGTRSHLISGILDRVNKLKDNTAMEIMLGNDCKNNINLLEEIQKPQLIVIRMPDSKFSTEEEKDIICSYWFSKIWLTLQLRDNIIRDRNRRVKVNLIWDELSQIPYTQGLLAKKLSQIAKFDCKNIVSCHYLDQIPIIKPELTGANTSYMLLQGCDENNYKELANVLRPYTVEDLINLKRYHSLNSIKYEGGYAKFITKLPKPIL